MGQDRFASGGWPDRHPGVAVFVVAAVTMLSIAVTAWSFLDWEAFRDFLTISGRRSESRARVVQVISPVMAATFGYSLRFAVPKYLNAPPRRDSR